MRCKRNWKIRGKIFYWWKSHTNFIIDWAKTFLAQQGNPQWLEEKKESANKRSKKYYQEKIASDKIKVYCEYCKEIHNPLRLTHNKNIARNGRYICEREGGHISGRKPKNHLKKINPYESEGKKECNNCHSILSFDSFSSRKNICKSCRADKYRLKYKNKNKDY